MTVTRTWFFGGIMTLLLEGITIAQERIEVPPPHKIYHGVSVGSADALQDKGDLYLKAVTGKVEAYLKAVTGAERPPRTSLAWVYFDSELDLKSKNGGFPSELCNAIFTTYGAIPYLRLSLKTVDKSESKNDLSFGHILKKNNELDSDIAEAVKKWGEEARKQKMPLLVEWGPECNAVWSPWHSCPEKFKLAYGALVKNVCMFDKKSGSRTNDNITWVFHIDASEKGPLDFVQYFPEKEYFDWIGVSVYGIPQKDLLVPFREKFVPIYDCIVDYQCIHDLNKPIVISAFGCPKTNGPAALRWTHQALDDLICDRDLNRVKGFSWWNATLTYGGMTNWKSGKDYWTYEGKGSFKKLGNKTWEFLGDHYDMQMENNPLAADVFRRNLSARKINHWPRIRSTSQ